MATLSLAVLALTGCSSAPTFNGASCDRTTHSSGIEDAVTVKGDLGTEPKVTVYTPVKGTKTTYADTITGKGLPLVNGQQVMTAELSIFSGNTGDLVYATSYDKSTGNLSNIDTWSGQVPGLAKVLECVTGGSRVIASLTPKDFGAEQLSNFGLKADDHPVFVIDVVDTFRSRAEGALQFNDARGVPTVVRAPDGRPGVIIPDAAAPTSQVVQTLIEGDGDPLEKTQTPVVNVTAVNWDDKSVLNTTWGANPMLDLASSAPAVAEALVGKPVGSQILVVTPAANGAGAVAYVVDILGAVTTAGK